MTHEPQTTGAAGVGAVGLMDVLRGIVRRRKKLVLFTALLFALAGFLFINVATPLYTATSRVLIDYEETPYTNPGIGRAASPARQISDRDVRSQVEVIKSQDLALKVLRDLKLIGTAEFDPARRPPGLVSRLKRMLGFNADFTRLTPEQRALREWNKRLKVYNLPGTKIVVIEFASTTPRTAAAVANALARAYVHQTQATRLAQTGEARQWLRQQIEKLRRKVVEAEKAVESYRAKAGLFRGTQAKLQNQQLSELSAQIVRAAAERSQAEARARAIRDMLKKGEVDRSAEVLRSPLIQRLREQQVLLKRRLAELSTVYLDNHPKVRAVKRELADLKRQINIEARKIAHSLEQQARIAAEREAELRARLAKLKARVSASSIDEVKLRELEREAKAQRSLLESFLARYTDAAARNDTVALPGMARIIERAHVPATPTFPKKGPIMVLSVLAGLMLGFGLAFVLEVMAAVHQAEAMVHAPSRTPAVVHTPEALAEQPTAASMVPSAPTKKDDSSVAAGPVRADALAEVPLRPLAEGGEKAAETTAGPTTGALEPAATEEKERSHTLRDDITSISRRAVRLIETWHQNENTQRVALTSLGLDEEEDAAISLTIGRALADQGRVILLDAEGPEGALAGRYPGPGLSDLLQGRATFADVVRVDRNAARLHVVPCGSLSPLPEALDNPPVHQLLQALEENYDYLLLHEGVPRYPLEAKRSVLPLAKAVVLLTRREFLGLAESLKTTLRQAGVKHCGCLVVGETEARPKQLDRPGEGVKTGLSR